MMRRAKMMNQVRWVLLSLFLVSTIDVARADQLLIAAVKDQDRAAVRALIAGDVDVNERQGSGATALHWAVHRDDIELVNLLIEAGADVDAMNDIGVMPLSLACENGSASMVEVLLKAGADSNAVLRTGETALMRAAFVGDLDTVDTLLAHGADVNAKEPVREQTALMWALDRQREDVVHRLVEKGADIEATTTLGFNPLLFAVRHNSVEAATLFLDAGADVNSASKENLSALHLAVKRGHLDVTKLLLERGADANADAPGYTPLHWATGTWDTEMTGKNGMKTPKDHEWHSLRGVQEDKFEIVKALLDHGADPNAALETNPKVWGYTVGLPAKNSRPVNLAAYAGAADVMRLLVERGADLSLRPDNYQTTLMLAVGSSRIVWISRVTEEESLEAVRAALELGADVNEVNGQGNTALHEAARRGLVEVARLLVENGANLEAKNKRGTKPVDMARYGADELGKPRAKGERPPVARLLSELSVQAEAQDKLRID